MPGSCEHATHVVTGPQARFDSRAPAADPAGSGKSAPYMSWLLQMSQDPRPGEYPFTRGSRIGSVAVLSVRRSCIVILGRCF